MFSKIDLFYNMQTPTDVASLLEVSNDVLNYRLYASQPRYTHFEISKKAGGTRKISVPHTGLKLLQLSLKDILNEIYEPRPSVHGFVQNRNIITNAKSHRKQKYVLNIDLKDFFPSIHFGRVRGLFMARPFNFSKSVAKTIAHICCEYEGLPQGAPTSPIISNMICRHMDGKLQLLAKRHQCFYTRYADDITFSTSKPLFPSALAKVVGNQTEVGEQLQTVIEENGFKINQSKVRLQNKYQRQEVTGLTVNQFANVNRKYINQVRAMIHDLNKDEEKALERHLTEFRQIHRNPIRHKPTSFREIVRGKVEFIGQVRGKYNIIYRRFLEQLGEIVTNPKIFINYASEDRNEVQKLHDTLTGLNYNTWIDTNEIKGDEWRKEINKGIDESYIFVACLTLISTTRGGVVQEEIDYALKKYHEAQEGNFFIFPLMMQKGIEKNIRSDLKDFSYIEYYKQDGIKNLRSALDEKISFLTS